MMTTGVGQEVVLVSEVDLRIQESNWRGGRGVSVSEALTQTHCQAHQGIKPPSTMHLQTPVSEGMFCMLMLEGYCINTLKLIYICNFFQPMVVFFQTSGFK